MVRQPMPGTGMAAASKRSDCKRTEAGKRMDDDVRIEGRNQVKRPGVGLRRSMSLPPPPPPVASAQDVKRILKRVILRLISTLAGFDVMLSQSAAADDLLLSLETQVRQSRDVIYLTPAFAPFFLLSLLLLSLIS